VDLQAGGRGIAGEELRARVTTNFARYDVPDFALSPTTRERAGEGWTLDWRYDSLVSGSNVAVAMPEHLQPGPVAGRISMFAPVSLLFFFFLLFLLTTMRGVDLHPMNYFFLAAAFFSFHLLLAYLVDWVSIHLAFALCSAVSIFLVVSYLRLVVGMRFALLEAGAMLVGLPRGLLVRLFPRGHDGACDHDRRDPDAVPRHAVDGAREVERGVRGEAGPGPAPGGCTPVED
jgi:hypothetical protein